MNTKRVEMMAQEAAGLFKIQVCELTEEIQKAMLEAAEQAHEDDREDYAISLSHSVKINPVKNKLESNVSVSVKYLSKATKELTDPNQPELKLVD